jgi:diguanylate cyclase (GGDEF)-like protein
MKQKILIADDEQAVQRVLTRAFESGPYELLSVSNGAEALTAAATQSPDMILLDVNMPVKNGWDVLKELRGNFQTRDIPVIMLTGYGAVDEKVDGLEMGADDYVTKPFAIAELRARVANTLHRNQAALSANPLSKLPGNPAIEEEVNRRIRENVPFAFLYVDINHFKSYNDAYGFAQGDNVLHAMAEMLRESLRSDGGRDWFAGHVGGDDFVMIVDPAQAANVAQRLASLFDERAPSFYPAPDRARGYIESENRQGHLERFPLVSLSIGIVSSQQRVLDHYAKVVQIASEMKSYCKSQSEHRLSRFAFDRRSDA